MEGTSPEQRPNKRKISYFQECCGRYLEDLETVYKRLKKIKEGDDGCQEEIDGKMVAAVDEANKVLAKSYLDNYLKMLVDYVPVEIWVQIFDYVKKEKTEKYSKIRLVCKHWKGIYDDSTVLKKKRFFEFMEMYPKNTVTTNFAKTEYTGEGYTEKYIVAMTPFLFGIALNYAYKSEIQKKMYLLDWMANDTDIYEQVCFLPNKENRNSTPDKWKYKISVVKENLQLELDVFNQKIGDEIDLLSIWNGVKTIQEAFIKDDAVPSKVGLSIINPKKNSEEKQKWQNLKSILGKYAPKKYVIGAYTVNVRDNDGESATFMKISHRSIVALAHRCLCEKRLLDDYYELLSPINEIANLW